MKARDVMSRPVRVCHGDSSLAEAARMMWEQNCGILPVVESMGGRLVGVITDRDICMGGAMRGDPLDRIPVRGCCSREIRTCGPDDDLERVQQVMRDHGLHRIPVVEAHDHVVGIVSLRDLADAALCETTPQATRDELVRTIATVHERSEVAPH